MNERCFKINCECAKFHPLGGVCRICGNDYDSNVDHFGKDVPPVYGDNYEQHYYERNINLKHDTENYLRAKVERLEKQMATLMPFLDHHGTVYSAIGNAHECIACMAVETEDGNINHVADCALIAVLAIRSPAKETA